MSTSIVYVCDNCGQVIKAPINGFIITGHIYKCADSTNSANVLVIEPDNDNYSLCQDCLIYKKLGFSIKTTR